MKYPNLQSVKSFLNEHLISSVRVFLKKVTKVFPHGFNFSGKNEPFVYVALGDSTVVGVGASHSDRAFPSLIFKSIQLKYPKAEYYNFGRGGSTIKDVRDEQLTQTIELNPSLITISIGANDIATHTKITDFERRLSELFERLSSQTKAKIVINSIPDLSATHNLSRFAKIYGNYRIRLFNRIIQHTADKFGALYVDLYLQSRIFAQNYPEVFSEDGLHPSDTGYALWANTIITNIQQKIFTAQ
jgi:acyl-CoA thioesterase I